MNIQSKTLSSVLRQRFKKKKTIETGFTMLEAVVVVGVLLALAVGGFLSYGPIVQNAKTAAVKSAASSVFTAILVAQVDGDPSTTPTGVVNDYNNSNSRFRAEIREAGTVAVVAAMTTDDYVPETDSDFCVSVTDTEIPSIAAEEGNCETEPAPEVPSPTEAPSPAPTPEPTPEPTPTPTPTVSPSYTVSWGDNFNGQLGNGTGTDSITPVAVNTAGVLAGKTITSVSAGSQHTCALADGKPYCWGYNNYGQLGNGNTTQSLTPVEVNTTGVLAGKTITTVSTGNFHTCVLTDDGQAYCWGYGGYGQLGNGTLTNTATTPVAVTTTGVLAGKTITAISTGGYHTCVVADNAAYCWGRGDYGQLGNNTSTLNSGNPVAVTATGVLAGKTVAAVSTGVYHSCAMADGKPYCWGYNGQGQLGNGTTTQSLNPVAVITTGALAGKTVTSVDSTHYHNCVMADGSPYCWGNNANGQLGNGNTTNSSTPVAVTTTGVLAGKTITSVATGNSHVCAIADSKPYCWGANDEGQLGNGNKTQSTTPVAVTTTGVLAGKTITSVEAGNRYTFVIYS